MDIQLTLHSNQIKLDVDTETRKASLIQIGEASPDERNEASMGEEYSDLAFFTRNQKHALDAVVAMLHKYISKISYTADGAEEEDNPAMKEGSNDIIDAERATITSFSLSLTMPPRRAVMPGVLTGMIHRYVVYHILHTWATMALPNLSAAYLERREAAAREIIALTTRKTPPAP